MKKIFVSLLTIGTILTMVVASTWTMFSDTETISDNSITMIKTGTLCLKVMVNGEKVVNGEAIINANVNPAGTGSAEINIKNDCTLDGNLKFSIYDVTGDLSRHMFIKYHNEEITIDAPLLSLNNQEYQLGILRANNAREMIISWELSPNIGNDLQGQTSSFSIKFELDQ